MPRPEKVRAVAEIKEQIESAQAVFVTEFRGMSVKQLQELRRGLRQAGAEYRVLKMTLARRAADELGIDGIAEHLSGPTALAFALTDPVATAKALRDAGRETGLLVVKAGILSGTVIAPEQVSKLAEIEPREVLLGKVARAAQAPLSRLAGLVSALPRNLANVMSQLLESKRSQTDDAGADVPADEEE